MWEKTKATDIERIYGDHGWHVLRRARLILKDENEAWDVCQDVFLRLVEKNASLRDPSRVAAWLFRATTNRCIDKLRTRKPLDPAELSKLASRLDIEDRAATRELFAHLASQIPAAEMHVAMLRFVDGLTMEELEQVCGKTRKTLAKRLVRFHKRARSILARHCTPGAES